MVNPEWIEAAAATVAAVEGGIGMGIRRKSVEQAVAAAVPAAPATPNLVVNNNGISRDDFLTGMLILAGAMLVLAAAMLASAAIVHHGLTA